MDRLEYAIYIIRKARAEKQRLERMNWELAHILPSHPMYAEYRRAILCSFAPIPREENINNLLNYARRILREELI